MRVTGLFVYPVKSCGGVALERAQVGEHGLVGDRGWLVVGQDGLQLTQRQHPRLALVSADLAAGGERLELRAPGLEPLAVIRPVAAGATADVWGDRVAVGDAGDEAAGWFSAYLGLPARLVALTAGYRRHARLAPAHQVSFADGYPLLLATQASLDELNRLAAEPVPMERFRPNLVVDGVEPWEDDTWGDLQVGAARFRAVKGCSRCSVPQVDQRTATRHKEPARVLAAHRRGEDGKTYFGQNLVHLDIGATVVIGDEVAVLRPR